MESEDSTSLVDLPLATLSLQKKAVPGCKARVCEEGTKSWRSPCAARGDYSMNGKRCQQRVQSVRGSPPPLSSPIEGEEIWMRPSIRASPYSGLLRMHPLGGQYAASVGLILSCVLGRVEACPEQRRRRCPEGVSKDASLDTGCALLGMHLLDRTQGVSSGQRKEPRADGPEALSFACALAHAFAQPNSGRCRSSGAERLR